MDSLPFLYVYAYGARCAPELQIQASYHGEQRKARTDPSGNKILYDVGPWLVDQIKVPI